MNTKRSTNISKKKIFVVRFCTAVLMFIFGMLFNVAGKAQENNSNPGNFYAITGNGLKDTSWLFGTYHLVKSSYLNEVPVVQAAFKKANGVVVEMVIDSSKLPAANAMGLLKDKTLSDFLDKPFADSLENELKNTLGVGVSQLNQFKPMNVMLILSMVYLVSDTNSRLHQYTGSLIDGYFAETGKQAGKKITALETIEEQMNILFNKSTDEEQMNQLKHFLRNKSEIINQGNELIENWFKHDLNKMNAVSEKGLKNFGSTNDLLKNRNDNWMKTLPGLLKKESQFIAVGALHLAGPHGLVKQLQQSGYTVTPIKL